MNVLITSPTYPPFNSGLGNAVQQQATALVANGFSVVVACGGEQRDRRRDPVSGALVEVFNVRGTESWLNPIRGDVAGYESFLTESNFDVVLMNAWQTWSTDLCLRNLDRIVGRKILYSHCLSANLFFRHQPLRSIFRYLLWRPYWWRLPARLRDLDRLIFLAADGCDSRFDDLRLAKRLGLPFEIIPNALSPPAFDLSRWPAVERGRRTHLIAIGAYEWLKGHDFALRAYALSRAKNVVPLKIFGQCFSPFTDRLRRLAATLGIADDYVTFHAGLSGAALLDECARSQALLCGSHTECQPLVLLDAMAVGTPFVARSTGCLATMAGGVGVRAEPEAAAAINRLLQDDREWARVSAAGRAEVLERHDPSRIGERLVSVLRAPKADHANR